MLEKVKEKFSILYIAQDKYPPSRVDVSVLFQEKITSRGHRIDWILQSEKETDLPATVYKDGYRVYLGKTDDGATFFNRLRKNVFRIMNEFRMINASRKFRYDCILVKDLFFSAFIAIVTSKLFQQKMVYWLSYPFPESDLYNYQNGTARYPLIYLLRGKINSFLLYRVIFPFCDHIFVQSEQMKKDISTMGIPGHKMTPVPMGVTVNKIPFFGYADTNEEKPEEKNVVYLGTLVKERKLDFLLHVFRKVLQKEDTAKLIYIGGGEDVSDEVLLKEETKRLQLEKSVVFTGQLPQEKAWAYIEKAHVCVSPYFPTPILNSTSPTKMIEYMAMGKAVVANDHPEQSSVLAESKAGICVPYDVDAFAEAIIHLLKNGKEAREMGQKGRQYVQCCRDYEYIADRVEQKILELINNERS